MVSTIFEPAQKQLAAQKQFSQLKPFELSLSKPVQKQEQKKQSLLFIPLDITQAKTQKTVQRQSSQSKPFELSLGKSVNTAQKQKQDIMSIEINPQVIKFVSPRPFMQSQDIGNPFNNISNQQQKRSERFDFGFGNFNFTFGGVGGNRQKKTRGVTSYFAYSVNPGIVGSIEQAGLPGLQVSGSSSIYKKVDRQLQNATRSSKGFDNILRTGGLGSTKKSKRKNDLWGF